MTEQKSLYLRATIHRILDDSAQPFIARAALCESGSGFDPEVFQLLRHWEAKGYLQILCDPDRAVDTEPIVKMLSYIERRSSIPGFLNWE